MHFSIIEQSVNGFHQLVFMKWVRLQSYTKTFLFDSLSVIFLISKKNITIYEGRIKTISSGQILLTASKILPLSSLGWMSPWQYYYHHEWSPTIQYKWLLSIRKYWDTLRWQSTECPYRKSFALAQSWLLRRAFLDTCQTSPMNIHDKLSCTLSKWMDPLI